MMKRIPLLLFIFWISAVCYAQEMSFYGVPFGSEQTVFTSKMMSNGFKWVTGTVEYNPITKSKAELTGDFWKAKDCTVYLYSYNPNTFTKSYPITEAWVIIHTDRYSIENLNIQAENAVKVYSELIGDFVNKYGNFSKEYRTRPDENTIEWNLNNGNIIAEYLMTNAIRIRYISSIRLKQLEEQNRFKGNGSDDL